MFNPTDRKLIDSMVSYQIERIQKDYETPVQEVAEVTISPPQAKGVVATSRTTVGLALMRTGARLAGIGLHTRMGPQL
jgi:hypothetical protein